MIVRAILPADRGSLSAYLALGAGDPLLRRGRHADAGAKPGFLAEAGGTFVGALLYELDRGDARVVLLHGDNSALSALVSEMVDEARRWNCGRVCVRLTNAELDTVNHLQRLGWDLLALHRDALRAARRQDPRVPTHSPDGVVLRHEVELELVL